MLVHQGDCQGVLQIRQWPLLEQALPDSAEQTERTKAPDPKREEPKGQKSCPQAEEGALGFRA